MNSRIYVLCEQSNDMIQLFILLEFLFFVFSSNQTAFNPQHMRRKGRAEISLCAFKS